MRKSEILMYLLLLFSTSAIGQVDNLTSTDVEKELEKIEIEDVNPDQIPSADELRKLGVPEDKIMELMLLKGNIEDEKTEELSGEEEQEPGEDIDVDSSKANEHVYSPKDKENSLLAPLVYGQGYFRNKKVQFFEKASDIKAPDNYVLGVGDEINVAVWGYTDYNEVFTIDSKGAIAPRGVGRIYLKGLTFENARALVKRKFASYMDLSSSMIDISLTYSRIITVNIVGEVNDPGSFTIPAINTAFNALNAANGPTQIGSVREIQVWRSGKKIKTLDLYEFLLNPEGKDEYFLENNDYIFIPPSGKVVNIEGAIKRPHNYELIEDENIHSLIFYAGGLNANAYKTNIQLIRTIDDEEVLIDINLDSLINNNIDYRILDGDQVIINKIPQGITNYVEIIGAVKLPGKYELRQGDKVADILKRAEGPLFDAYLGKAYVIRIKDDLSRNYKAVVLSDILKNETSPENLILQNFDVIQVFAKASFRDDYYVTIFGAVRMPEKYLYGEGLTLKDLLYLAGGLKVEAANNRIEISRILNFNESVKESIPTRTIVKSIEIQKDLNIDQASAGFELHPFDQIFVRTIPDFELQQNVKIMGEVMYPGNYSLIDHNEKLVTLIERAGGVTDWAFVEGAKLHRNENDIGYLFTDLKRALDNPQRSKFNYVLKAGDIILIPKINELVNIEGAVNYPNIDEIGSINAPYHKGKAAGYYIRKYGVGFKDDALKRKTIVVQAGGYVKRTVSFGLFKVYPVVDKGASIRVVKKPVKKKEEKKEREPLDWNKTLENFMIKAAAILTIVLLVDRVAN